MPPPSAGSPSTPGSCGPPPPGSPPKGGGSPRPPCRSPARSARATPAGAADSRSPGFPAPPSPQPHLEKEPEMSLSNFNPPSPIAVTLDLYVADVHIVAADRADTIVEVRPSDP